MSEMKILCVDDESDLIELLSESVRSIGFVPIAASNVDEAMVQIRRHHADLLFVISDYKMGEMNGIDLRREMLADYADIPFCIISAYVTKEIALTGIDCKITAFYEKPVDESTLGKLIKEKSKERITQIQENRALAEIFFQEAEEILAEVEDLMMDLEANPDDKDLINRIFRLVHTIKGSSATIGSTDIKNLAHALEDLLTLAKEPGRTCDAALVTVLLTANDQVVDLINSCKTGGEPSFDLEEAIRNLVAFTEQFKSGGVTAKKAVQQKVVKSKNQDQDEKIVVPTETLDEFLQLSGEITVLRNMVRKIIVTLERNMSGNADIKLLSELLYEMHKINSLMQEKITELRKVSVASVFRPLNRIVRDSSQMLKKQVQLTTLGDSLRIDTRISKALSGCLVHMVRNCCDHGIETPEARQAVGKDPKGTVVLSAQEINDRIIFEIKDDGKGLDPEKIGNKAIEKGLKTREEIASMSQQQIFALIFEPGFSTAQVVSEISGRGVGMDMVRNSINEVNGNVVINSKVGEGTTFVIDVPVPKSVQIINSLVVRAYDQLFAIPQEFIDRLLIREPSSQNIELRPLEGACVLRFQGRYIPLICLAEALGARSKVNWKQLAKSEETIRIVVIKSENGSFGVVVDEIHDSEDIVLKPIQQGLRSIGAYSAATFMDDGSVGLVLDIEGIAKIAGCKLSELEPDQIVSHSAINGLQSQIDQMRSQSAKSYLTFELPGLDGDFGVPLDCVHRLESRQSTLIQDIRDYPTLIYNDHVMPILDWAEHTDLGCRPFSQGRKKDTISFFVVKHQDRFFGFVIEVFNDVVTSERDLDETVRDGKTLKGNLLLPNRNILILDPIAVVKGSGLIFIAESGDYRVSQLQQGDTKDVCNS